MGFGDAIKFRRLGMFVPKRFFCDSSQSHLRLADVTTKWRSFLQADLRGVLSVRKCGLVTLKSHDERS